MTPADYFRGLQLAPTARSSRAWAAFPAWARLRLFFMSGVGSVEYLRLLYHVCLECMQRGVPEGEFIHQARAAIRKSPGILGAGHLDDDARLERWAPEAVREYERSTAPPDSLARLRQVYRYYREVSFGYVNFLQDMQPAQLRMWPAWQLCVRNGLTESCADITAHDGEIRLKTDFPYWMARNSESHGGTGMPFAPFGADAVGLVCSVSRGECVQLGLCGYKDVIEPTAEQRAQWGLDGTPPPVPSFIGAVCPP